MGKKRSFLLIITAIVLTVLSVKAVLFFTVKPKITVDYVAEYNRTSRPQNYDPNDNAAPYYQKAFDAFVDMPDELHKPSVTWPTDLNDIEQAILKKWLASNSQSFEYFKTAAHMPYYWLERHTKRNNNMFNIKFSEISSLSHLTKALMWDAKLDASKGRSLTAFENIIACYRAGRQKCRTPSLLMEQHVGLDIKQAAMSNALVILDRAQVDNTTLKLFQDALQAEFDSDTYIPDFTVEKLSLYDALQMTFIDNGKGAGRLAWRTGWYYDMLCGKLNNFKRRLYACFIGPTRNQIVQQIERVIVTSDRIMAKTPWQVKNETYKYFEEIEKINNSNWFLQIFGISPKSTFHLYHKTRAQTEALIAVLAILRFKADNYRLPATLDELVDAGYLQTVPMDPYSDGPLVYKLAEDNFKLYSIGEDFSDDGGVIEVVNKARQEPGFRGTSIVPHVYSPDIVYWPVKKLEKLRYEFTFEEAEKLRAEKEAEARRKIKEVDL